MPFYVYGGKRGDGGKLDSPEDVARLATFDEVQAKLTEPYNPFAGLGFALGPDGTGCHWQGIDLDNVADHGLQDLAARVPGYVEYSPSGKGCHAIGYGRWFRTLAQDGSGIEAYSAGRFFTWTGNVISDGGLLCLADYVEQELRTRHGGQDEPAADLFERQPDEPQMADDDVVMRSFWYAKNAEKFQRLWQGEDVHGNPSVNDWNLLIQLAFYTRNDEQLTRLFLRSARGPELFRKESEREARRYMERTINRVRAVHAPRLKRLARLQAAMAGGLDAAMVQRPAG